jgi:hypothetical protein
MNNFYLSNAATSRSDDESATNPLQVYPTPDTEYLLVTEGTESLSSYQEFCAERLQRGDAAAAAGLTRAQVETQKYLENEARKAQDAAETHDVLCGLYHSACKKNEEDTRTIEGLEKTKREYENDMQTFVGHIEALQTENDNSTCRESNIREVCAAQRVEMSGMAEATRGCLVDAESAINRLCASEAVVTDLRTQLDTVTGKRTFEMREAAAQRVTFQVNARNVFEDQRLQNQTILSNLELLLVQREEKLRLSEEKVAQLEEDAVHLSARNEVLFDEHLRFEKLFQAHQRQQNQEFHLSKSLKERNDQLEERIVALEAENATSKVYHKAKRSVKKADPGSSQEPLNAVEALGNAFSGLVFGYTEDTRLVNEAKKPRW